MEELTDNDIHISPLTIIKNRYGEGGEFLAFNLESWEVPKEINDDGLDFISFWHHDAQKYIIGKGDTPQEALDNLKAKLNPAPDNPLIDKFLFLDFEGIANLGDQDFRENLQFIVEQTHCKIIITSLCRLDGPETVHEKWRSFKCLLSITRSCYVWLFARPEQSFSREHRIKQTVQGSGNQHMVGSECNEGLSLCNPRFEQRLLY